MPRSEDPKVIADVHQESLDDLVRLLPPAHTALEKHGPVRGAVELASGLIDQESWGRIELASVLGVALIRIAQFDGGDSRG